MSAAQTAERLTAFERRGAGTDVERRAAQWLAAQLRGPGREVCLEPFWCRPNWALAHAWHVLLALAGSLVSVSSPRLGGALLLIALVSVIVDERLGFSPGRRLTPERASQNVIVTSTPAEKAPPVHLIITANYDAGRIGLAYRDPLRAPFAQATAVFGRLGPVWLGWLGWLVVAIAWLTVIAILRLDGDHGTAIGIAQLVPTAGLVVALALLLELGSSGHGPAAADNASGVAVAVALVNALAAAPPTEASVELVLQGAGDGFGIGLRRYLSARRDELRADNTVVLGIAPCGAGRPRWWISDGQLIPLRYLERLTVLCSKLAHDSPAIRATAYRGRGATPAFRATSARRPAIAIGCLDEQARVPRSHRSDDTADYLDPAAIDATLHFGLLLADSIDAFLRERPSGRRHRVVFRRPLPVLAGGERKSPDEL